jgi:hypothetical protein
LLGERFKIRNIIIGVGSFGRAYIGRDKKLRKDIAIKIVNYLEIKVRM